MAFFLVQQSVMEAEIEAKMAGFLHDIADVCGAHWHRGGGEEERRRGGNTWVRVHASLQPLFLGENDAAAEKGMPYCCGTPRLPPPHSVCVPGTS